MKKWPIDSRFIFALLIAHALIYFSFHDKAIFWYIFSGSILVLIAFAMFQGEVDDQLSFFHYFFIGAASGLLLYFCFWLGYQLIGVLHLPLNNEISRLYKWFAPSLFWHYIALILVAAPGEELFWRGYIQKRLTSSLKPIWGIVIGAVLYGTVHIYSGSFLLILTAFFSGIVWGALYHWKKSMPLVIVSHIIFDMMIFIILPFR